MKNESILNETYIRGLKKVDEETFEEILMEINLKKPKSAYIYFQEEYSLNNINNINLGNIDKKNYPNWANLSETDKNKYKEMYEEDRKRYKYNLELVKKFILDKPLEENASSYKIFIDEHIRNAIENDRDLKDARKEANNKWKSLSSEEKNFYDLKKDQHKELYESLRRMQRPNTAVNLFVKDQIILAEQRGENITFGEAIVKWKKLKPSIKDKYILLSDELKEEKERMRDLYEVTFGIKPKKPLGPYLFFIMEKVKEGKIKGSPPYKEELKIWRQMTEEQKERYNKLSKKNKLAYKFKKTCKNNCKNNCNAFSLFASSIKDKLKDCVSSRTNFEVFHESWMKLDPEEKMKFRRMAKEKNLEKNQDKNMIDKPKMPCNAFTIYLKEYYNNNKNDMPHPRYLPDISRVISEKWKNLPENEKKKYNDLFQKNFLEYKNKMMVFNKKLSKETKNEYSISCEESKKRNRIDARVKYNANENEADNEESMKLRSRSKKPKKSK